ncbi:MAG: membrane protein insertase YidC [Putridiphycobacter sp.]
MDKNTIVGLLLIGGILFTFSWLNKPTEEEIAENKAKIEAVDSTQKSIEKTEDLIEETQETISALIPKLDEEGNQVIDSNLNAYVYRDTIANKDSLVPIVNEVVKEKVIVEAKTYTLENDKIKIEVSNKGGKIINAKIKGYSNYDDFSKGKDNPLELFDDHSVYGIEYAHNGAIKNTQDLDFSVVESSEKFIKLSAKDGNGTVFINYKLNDNAYDLDYTVSFKGFSDADADQTKLSADFKLLATEKHLQTEQRVSTIFYDEDGKYTYLSEASDDEELTEETAKWVAFKQSFFSAMFMYDKGFKSGSKVEIKTLGESDTTYLKEYKADLDLGMTSFDTPVSMKIFLGPNDYELLAEYNNGSEDIVNLGWGLFRWINVYALRPMFKAFMNWGISAGWAILLLTILVKLVLSPVNYKMYKSSAMMRVLKPEITEINEKYPNKEDAMKKQQALMALYREAGASPMAGCVPMLFQMPILFAIFRLFPSAIEMRQKGFLWAEDLSTYDSIYNFGFDVPLYGDHISLFTLLMAFTTLAYTHFNSQNMQQPQQEGMPNMKYIMYFFPIMMIFFFNNYSSGLSYYYFISTLMTMGIMFAIKKFILDEKKIHAKVQANKANPKKKKGKSKFAQRLEEAQRMQMEKQKNKNK